MKISLIIPAYNEELYLRNCLLSVEKYQTKDICEVIVVDNGSTDNTAKIASQFSFVTLVNEHQKGNSYARQKGLTRATGTLVAFLDADTCITKNWVEIAIREFKSNDKLVALSGPYRFYDFNNIFKDGVVWIYFNIFTYLLSKVTGSVVICGNLVIKKDAIIKIGGFDTSIVFYGDDTNIARRLQEVGKVKFQKDFIVYSSARRLKKEGMVKTGFIYVINYFSEKFLHLQVTKTYKDIR